MIGYRSVFNIQDVDDLDKEINSQFLSWLRAKELRVDDLEEGRHHLGEGAVIDVTMVGSREDTVRRRIRLSEPSGWTTQLTTEQVSGESPWIWLDIDAPVANTWAATPKLIRNLVAAFDAFDGEARLRERPLQVREEDLDQLIDVVCDPDRRGLIFLAGSDTTLPWPEWVDNVDAILADTVGLSAAYLMDPATTTAFAAKVGPSHAVPVGGIRTFRPDADPAVAVDGRRHRILGPARIAADPAWRLRRTLGWASREQLFDLPLPKRLTRVDRLLRQQAAETLVDQLSLVPSAVHGTPALSPQASAAGDTVTEPAVTPVIEPIAPAARPTVGTEPMPGPGSGPATAPSEESPIAVPQHDILTGVVSAILGSTARATPDNLQRIVRLAKQGQATPETLAELRQQLLDLLSQRAELQDAEADMQGQLDEAQLDRAAELHNSIKLQDKVRYLQRQLTQAGQAEAAWSEVPTEDSTAIPESFVELFDRAGELRHVVITADHDKAFELDKQDVLHNSAAKAWTALLALDDYAEARRTGAFKHGVHPYLKDTPAGFRGYSANAHSPVESDQIKNNPKFHDCRVFPVSESVDPTGRSYMDAHMKLGAKKTVSPRIHYLDATQIDEHIYVGYIGRHLESPKTN